MSSLSYIRYILLFIRLNTEIHFPVMMNGLYVILTKESGHIFSLGLSIMIILKIS